MIVPWDQSTFFLTNCRAFVSPTISRWSKRWWYLHDFYFNYKHSIRYIDDEPIRTVVLKIGVSNTITVTFLRSWYLEYPARVIDVSPANISFARIHLFSWKIQILTVFRSLAKNWGQINFSLIKRVFHCRFPDITLVDKGLSPVLKEFKK